MQQNSKEDRRDEIDAPPWLKDAIERGRAIIEESCREAENSPRRSRPVRRFTPKVV